MVSGLVLYSCVLDKVLVINKPFGMAVARKLPPPPHLNLVLKCDVYGIVSEHCKICIHLTLTSHLLLVAISHYSFYLLQVLSQWTDWGCLAFSST